MQNTSAKNSLSCLLFSLSCSLWIPRPPLPHQIKLLIAAFKGLLNCVLHTYSPVLRFQSFPTPSALPVVPALSSHVSASHVNPSVFFSAMCCAWKVLPELISKANNLSIFKPHLKTEFCHVSYEKSSWFLLSEQRKTWPKITLTPLFLCFSHSA